MMGADKIYYIQIVSALQKNVELTNILTLFVKALLRNNFRTQSEHMDKVL